MKMKTSGVLVVGINKNLPAKKAGIKNGDIIKKVNGIDVLNTSHFEDIIKASENQPLDIELIRNNDNMKAVVKPEKDESEHYVCGMWLRDSAAGIGTITFVTEDKKSFGALGHPVNDIDTDETYDLRTGTLEKSEIKSVKIGEKNRPGELIGVFKSNKIGTILFNNHFGLYGQISDESIVENDPILSIMPKNEVKIGKAKIISTVSTEGKKEYDIDIVRVSDSKDNKDFIIKITDETLINTTGGIVQGMSGSPIIQENRLVGAVTHVMINDPKKGYGISIEKMISQMK